MPLISDDIWIFSKEGYGMVNFNDQEQLSEDLLGSFVKTIKDFGQLSGTDLRSVTLNNLKYTCMSCCENHAFIVYRTRSSVKDKKIAKSCLLVKDLLEDMYEMDEIINWKGDPSYFDNFKRKLDLYFKMCNL